MANLGANQHRNRLDGDEAQVSSPAPADPFSDLQVTLPKVTRLERLFGDDAPAPAAAPEALPPAREMMEVFHLRLNSGLTFESAREILTNRGMFDISPLGASHLEACGPAHEVHRMSKTMELGYVRPVHGYYAMRESE